MLNQIISFEFTCSDLFRIADWRLVKKNISCKYFECAFQRREDKIKRKNVQLVKNKTEERKTDIYKKNHCIQTKNLFYLTFNK